MCDYPTAVAGSFKHTQTAGSAGEQNDIRIAGGSHSAGCDFEIHRADLGVEIAILAIGALVIKRIRIDHQDLARFGVLLKLSSGGSAGDVQTSPVRTYIHTVQTGRSRAYRDRLDMLVKRIRTGIDVNNVNRSAVIIGNVGIMVTDHNLLGRGASGQLDVIHHRVCAGINVNLLESHGIDYRDAGRQAKAHIDTGVIQGWSHIPGVGQFFSGLICYRNAFHQITGGVYNRNFALPCIHIAPESQGGEHVTVFRWRQTHAVTLEFFQNSVMFISENPADPNCGQSQDHRGRYSHSDLGRARRRNVFSQGLLRPYLEVYIEVAVRIAEVISRNNEFRLAAAQIELNTGDFRLIRHGYFRDIHIKRDRSPATGINIRRRNDR